MYLVRAKRSGVLCLEGWFPFFGQIQEVSIADNASELCDGCFKVCKSLRCVTFGSSSSLERIGVSCFQGTAIVEAAIPDGARELCDFAFYECKSLFCVKFGFASSLERIGDFCFGNSGQELTCQFEDTTFCDTSWGKPV